ncbi:hypothetical protein G6F56_001020 [Rhizopus delemar]|nr:hypothetical protein G6F56_001020 [Rhizopus delemar]
MSKEATGPPTRDHWKAAQPILDCLTEGTTVESAVTFSVQRTVPAILDLTKYNRWQEELRRPKNKENKDNSRNRLSLKKRHAGIMTQQPQAMEGVTELGRDDIVSKGVNINKSTKKEQAFHPIPSVPTDWQWSTF